MIGTGWYRLGALGGIVWIVLAFAAIVPLTPVPTTEASVSSFAQFFADERSDILRAAFLVGLGSSFFVGFLGVLHAVLRQAEGGEGALANTFLVSGAALVILYDVAFTAGAVGAFSLAREPNAGLILRGLFDVWNLAETFARLIFAVGTFAMSVVVLKTGVLPRWIGWLTIVLTVLNVGIGAQFFAESGPLSVTGAIGFIWFIVFSVWTVVIGISLARNPEPGTVGRSRREAVQLA